MTELDIYNDLLSKIREHRDEITVQDVESFDVIFRDGDKILKEWVRMLVYLRMGGPTTKKIMPPGKSQDVLCLFVLFLFFFLFFFQNTSKTDVFVSNLVKNVSSKKRTKNHVLCLFVSFLFFFVVFCCFCWIWLTNCPQTENKIEHKRSCRRENLKISFVFFVETPPPPPSS